MQVVGSKHGNAELRGALVGDAGYCAAAGMESVVARRGDVLVRINPQALVL